MFSPINLAGVTPFNDWFAVDTTQRHPLGYLVDGVDPYWGYAQFRYVKSNDAILKGSVCRVGQAPTFLATLVPITANLAQPLGIAMVPMASGTFGWLQVVGSAVYAMGATAAADGALGIFTSAGSLTGTIVAGRGVIGIHHHRAPAATITVAANTRNGSNAITTNGYDGFFLGMTLTGTGINGSATVVAGLDPDGNTIYTGSAIGTLTGRNSTATGSITLTGTYTGFGNGYIQYPTSGSQVTA